MKILLWLTLNKFLSMRSNSVKTYSEPRTIIYFQCLYCFQTLNKYVQAFTKSNSTIKTLEKGVKYVQCYQNHIIEPRSAMFIVNFEHFSYFFSIVSFVDFEQVNVFWEIYVCHFTIHTQMQLIRFNCKNHFQIYFCDIM